MDTSGHIRYTKDPAANEIPLSEQQAVELKRRSTKKRKNWMRNQPCKCGSGKKMKRCCWTKMARMNGGA